jgi:hypothetical protein
MTAPYVPANEKNPYRCQHAPLKNTSADRTRGPTISPDRERSGAAWSRLHAPSSAAAAHHVSLTPFTHARTSHPFSPPPTATPHTFLLASIFARCVRTHLRRRQLHLELIGVVVHLRGVAPAHLARHHGRFRGGSGVGRVR